MTTYTTDLGMTAGNEDPPIEDEPIEELPTDDPADDPTPVEGAPV